MKSNKIREMNDKELQDELKELKTEFFKLRFQYATNQLENPMKLNLVKKDIARVKTIIREREIKSTASSL
ncbi:MAG: 50S ribosomal protein L29 [Eubacteriales bacterium]|nr:50S ribosomal protein L29 [Eubacteriales bacterium]